MGRRVARPASRLARRRRADREGQDGRRAAQTKPWLEACRADPLRFVAEAFCWGAERLTGCGEHGPAPWQRRQLAEIGEALTAAPHAPVQHATASGHGVGKSALAAWLVLWGLMTLEDTRGVVTANTEVQLRTKTWAELAKWRGRLGPELRETVVVEASAIRPADRARARAWRIDAVAWNERSTEAFAGLHNAGRRVLMVFDEASAIPDAVWDTAEGATTDAGTQVIWCVFGNPTRNSGRFREAVRGRFRHLWKGRSVDSRSVDRTNKARIEQWLDSYGEDSDFVRIRVKGEFPRASSTQFIATDLVQAARARAPGYIAWDPVVFGVDVARFGDDASVLAIRRGRDARSHPWKTWRKMDTMDIAAHVAEQARRLEPAAIFVDVSGGLGAGVADGLRFLGHRRQVIDVQFGATGGPVILNGGLTLRAANKSAEMWMKMREWLEAGAIPDDDAVEADLTGREYGFRGADSAIQLEAKDDMKRRGLASPDHADALALTFAYPVTPRTPGAARAGATGAGGPDYDVHGDLRR
jgi:hypothetical protein